MNRIGKLVLAILIFAGCMVFAGALFGGLMDDSAFTPAVRGAAH